MIKKNTFTLINQKPDKTEACKYLSFIKLTKDIWIAHLTFPPLFIVDDIFTWNTDIIQLFFLQEVPATAH